MTRFYTYVNEAAYKGNLGFEELVKFYQKANDEQMEKMEIILKMLIEVSLKNG